MDQPADGEQRSSRKARLVGQNLDNHDDRDSGENERQYLKHGTSRQLIRSNVPYPGESGGQYNDLALVGTSARAA